MIDKWVHQDASKPAFALSELDALVQNGVLQPDSLIRHISSEEWLTVSEVMAAVARHADSEMANQSAARVLRNMATQRLHAKPSEKRAVVKARITSSTWSAIKNSLWAIFEVVMSFVGSIANRMLQYVNRKAILWTFLVASVTTLLWASGVFKPTTKDLPDHLNEIWRNAVEFSGDSAAEAGWNTFTEENLTRLAAISSELETTQQKPGIFSALRSPSDNKWARWELIQIAKYEIPLALKAGPEKLSEFSEAVESRLLRYDEFTARSSQPRLDNNFVFPSDVIEAATGDTATSDPDFATWLFVGLECILVLGGCSWWISRRSSSRSQQATSE